MPIIAQGQVGPTASSDGTTQNLRQGKSGELIATELHGKFYEQNYRGNLFIATQAAAGLAISIFSAAVQNFLVYNPLGSGVNCVPCKLIIGYVSGADIPGHLCLGHSLTVQAAPGTTTLATIFNGRLGVAASPGKVQVYAPATPAVALTYHSPLDFSLETAVAASTNNMDIASKDFDGQYIAPPGAIFSIASNVAQTTRISVISLIYEEVPV